MASLSKEQITRRIARSYEALALPHGSDLIVGSVALFLHGIQPSVNTYDGKLRPRDLDIAMPLKNILDFTKYYHTLTHPDYIIENIRRSPEQTLITLTPRDSSLMHIDIIGRYNFPLPLILPSAWTRRIFSAQSDKKFRSLYDKRKTINGLPVIDLDSIRSELAIRALNPLDRVATRDLRSLKQYQ